MTLANLTPQRYINECCDGSKTARLTWTVHCNRGHVLWKTHSWEHPQTNLARSKDQPSWRTASEKWFPFTPPDHEFLDLLSLNFCTADYQITIITITHNLFIYQKKTQTTNTRISSRLHQKCWRGACEEWTRISTSGNPTQKELILTPCCKYKPKWNSDPKKGLWLIQHKPKQFLIVLIETLPE